MITFKPFDPKYLSLVCLQEEQSAELPDAEFDPDYSFALFAKEQILGIFGIIEVSAGRFALISLIDKNSGKYMLFMVKKFKKMIALGIKEKKIARLEAYVRTDFAAGKRLITMLGFEREGTLRKFYKSMDYDIFAKIN